MRNYINSLLKLSIAITFIIFSLGCSKNSDITAAVEDKDSSKNSKASQVDELPSNETLPNGNPNTPLETYKEITHNNELMFIYYGFPNAQVDHNRILENFSAEYRATSDPFKRGDLSKSLKPKLQQEIESNRNDRYIKMNVKLFNKLSHYDFGLKGFPQKAVLNNTNFGWNSNEWKNKGVIITSYLVKFTNGDDFKVLKVNDEGVARKIEEKRNKLEKMNLVVYGFVQGIDIENFQLQTQILKISLVGEDGIELLILE